MEIRAFEPADESDVVRLWERCGLIRPWNDPHKDIVRKLSMQRELFFVGSVDGKIVATVMAGYEGHRGWLSYLGVDPDYRCRGLGRAIVEAAEARLRALGCPKINLQVRSSNEAAMEFYRQIGFVQDEVVSFGKRLEHDDRPN
jgi:ribosomal protein S18 acetylase RimI-like enzyme